MFWPFATSMEELMMFTGRGYYLDRYGNFSADGSTETDDHATLAKKSENPSPE